MRDKLRTAVAQAVAGLQIADLPPVDEVIGPLYKPEDLYDQTTEGLTPKPRVPVWISGGEIQSVQGPDWNTAVISVGVIGTTFDAEDYSLTDEKMRAQERAAADKLDRMLQLIQRKLTPVVADVLYRVDGGDTCYRFQSITRPLQLDPALYREQGVWLSTLFLTYMDEYDEDDE